MAQAHFITVDYFKQRVNTTASADDIQRAISTAMYLHIMPLMGTDFYNDYRTKIIAGTLTASTATYLMDNFIQPLTREYALYELMSQKAYRIEDTGLYTNEPDKLKSLDLDTIKYHQSNVLSFANQLAEETKHYLCEHSSSYPLYTNTTDQFIDPSEEDQDWSLGIT